MRRLLIPLLCLAIAGCVGTVQRERPSRYSLDSRTEKEEPDLFLAQQQEQVRRSVEAYRKGRVAVGKPIEGVRYFPKHFGRKTKDSPAIVSEFGQWVFTGSLRRANEPSLFEISEANRDPTKSTVRFKWIVEWGRSAFIRFEIEKNQTTMIAKQFFGEGECGTGFARFEERVLTEEEAERLSSLIAETDLFNLPSKDSEASRSKASSWVVETARPQKYNYLDRWPREGPTEKFGRLAIELSGFEPVRLGGGIICPP